MGYQCEICGDTPERNPNIILIRVNEKGVAARHVCRACGPPEAPDLTPILDIFDKRAGKAS